jgi:3'(2'), 5'-bisphosphate nucleotidase
MKNQTYFVTLNFFSKPMINSQQLELMIDASVRAGDAIMEIYKQPEIESVMKEDRSPLTLADQRADEIILNYLNETGIPVLSEESLKQPWEIRKSWTHCWIVDPLDGTKEFIRKNGEFTVNIALAIHGKPVMGVIFAPATGELYFGSEGSGAYKVNLQQGTELPVTASDMIKMAKKIPFQNPQQDGFTVVASRSHRNAETEDYIRGLEKNHEQVTTLSRGSSLKICMVAEGIASVYPRFAPTMEWDTAAGQAIATAAGCRMYNPVSGESLLYNKEHLENPWFVVDRI